MEASVRPEFGAGSVEHPWIWTRVEAQTRPEFRVLAPPILPTEHPWIIRAADEFWEELQNEVLMDTGPDLNEAEAKEGRLLRP